jgi:hypothetical protein
MSTISSYTDFNREERHFCAILMHALLSSKEVAEAFISLIKDTARSEEPRVLDTESLEVFLEPAVLRDHWSSLGPWKSDTAYFNETHLNRRELLKQLFSNHGISDGVFNEAFLWTGVPHESKLRFPGRWSHRSLQESSLSKEHKCVLNEKERVVFNAIPDLLLSSSAGLLFIEAKLLSPEGKDSHGYNQYRTTKLIAERVKQVVPVYQDASQSRSLIIATKSAAAAEKEGVPTLLWKCIGVSFHDTGKLDDFSASAMSRLSKFPSEPCPHGGVHDRRL